MKDIRLLEQKPLMDAYLSKGPRPLSVYSFVPVFAWCDFFDFEFKLIHENLCVFARNEAGCFLYLPPLGDKLNISTVEEVFKHMSGGKPKPVNRIENIPENLLSAFKPGSYNQYTKPAEYVYRKEDLIALRGNAYKSQRHDCNLFINRHPGHGWAAYDDDDLGACMELYEHWAGQRAGRSSDEIYKLMLQENRRVHGRLLKYRKALDLTAMVLKAEGKIIGYTFGYALDRDTFCVYGEIADLEVPGAAAFMFRSFCADARLKDFRRINTMDDFAMPNVARAKLAYHPSERLVSYTLSLKTGK